MEEKIVATKKQITGEQTANARSPEPIASSQPDERKMEQIRDILFGGISRDYDRKFHELGERLNQEVVRVERELERRLAAIDSRLEEVAERMLSQLRQESSARTVAMDDLDTRLGQSMKTQRTELSAAIDRLDQDLTQTNARSREALASLHSESAAAMQELREAVTRDRDQMRNEKVGREDLADMMGELSLRLRGALELPDIG